MPLQINAANPDPELMSLPWDRPLEKWPTRFLAALPRGISRHTVRFVRLKSSVVAIKETPAPIAWREYRMLQKLVRLKTPCVTPAAVITERTNIHGEELLSCLVTNHLPFSLPYRALFSSGIDEATTTRLIDALAVLLVKLHLLGFFWGDVSLSNTLFRRDAAGFSAYLVDAETGELHEELTAGQRGHDLELARVNIIGELMDLQAAGLIPEDADVVGIGTRVVSSYENLWDELTSEETIAMDERWKLARRIERLEDLGFDVAEMTMVHDAGKEAFVIQPKVVDAGHNKRRVRFLTGLDVHEKQAKRILDTMRTWASAKGIDEEPNQELARRWMMEIYEPTVEMIPRELTHKLERAQLFHEILEHRWYLSERAGRDIGMKQAAKSYLRNQLADKPDEEAFLNFTGSDDDLDDSKPED
ncbi:DUF4032 domain-containing protein [Corynebacterium mendelii]|uniref:DUF4032 domain-containing protein n=1 Tax=Corynebacterium mendelii TaxID=2765362 RepID=A0A939E1G8_9CORY|nr:DUF4032 domain-containing protein [Corynebacterium mendelii]MBN9645234.1 DUF4032 domain-containing protein [Corynebacterium mendelii]